MVESSESKNCSDSAYKTGIQDVIDYTAASKFDDECKDFVMKRNKKSKNKEDWDSDDYKSD